MVVYRRVKRKEERERESRRHRNLQLVDSPRRPALFEYNLASDKDAKLEVRYSPFLALCHSSRINVSSLPLSLRPSRSLTSSLQAAAGQAGAVVQGATQSIDLNQTSSKLSKSFSTLTQTVKERTGQTVEDDITELPQEYLDLERRVDGLKNAHTSLLKVAKAYEGNVDYPVNLGESATEIGGSLAHNLSAWAAAATKGKFHYSLLYLFPPSPTYPF